jgi:hypothetical protein
MADARFDHRALGQGGEPLLHVGADVVEGGRPWAGVAFVGSKGTPWASCADLETAALEVREAVVDVAVVEVRPAGKVLRLEPVVAARGRRRRPSWRVGKIRLPTIEGTPFGSQGPQAKT